MHMCMNMHTDMCVDMCMDMCVGLCKDMCVQMCMIHMCMDMCIDSFKSCTPLADASERVRVEQLRLIDAREPTKKQKCA